jgi:hypothetical protein
MIMVLAVAGALSLLIASVWVRGASDSHRRVASPPKKRQPIAYPPTPLIIELVLDNSNYWRSQAEVSEIRLNPECRRLTATTFKCHLEKQECNLCDLVDLVDLGHIWVLDIDDTDLLPIIFTVYKAEWMPGAPKPPLGHFNAKRLLRKG